MQEILSVLLEIKADLKLLLPLQHVEEEVLLDNSDAKRLLKICDSTLYRLRKKNLLSFRVIGKKLYYAKSDLINLKNSL